MRFVDLTHPLMDGGPCYPGDPPLAIARWATLEKDTYNLSQICMGSHQGTHLDAPCHFLPGGEGVDRMPLERFYGSATVIRIPKLPSSEISEEDLSAMEPTERVLLDTGWGRRFGHPGFYEEFPSLSVDACRLLISKGVRLLGLDTPSPSRDFVEAHHVLLGAGVVIVESLANLDQIPSKVVFCAFPLRFVGGDGSPVRAVAMLE